MSKFNARAMYYMMLGGAMSLPAVVDHSCDPYTKPPNTAADVTMPDAVSVLPNYAADGMLCEEMT